MKRVEIRLASVPRFAEGEYHPDQVFLYSKLTELTYMALNLPSISEFLEVFAEELDLELVQVVVNRLPASRSRKIPVLIKGKIRFTGELLHSIALKERSVIVLFPDLLWPARKTRPSWSIGLRGQFLNVSLRAVIHEMLHLSSMNEEDEVRNLTDRHYKVFRRTNLSLFEKEFRPLLKEWKKAVKLLNL